MPVVEVQQVHRRYGATEALAGVSCSVASGQIVGLLGPNGAGKTTLMKILTGLLAPTRGRAWINGHDVLTEPLQARRQLGWLPEGAPLYEEMTVIGLLRFVARARGLRTAETALALDRVASATGLIPRLHQRIGTLSRGFRQRVGLAQALIHAPPILILDEPTTGLDPNQVIEIRELVRAVGETRTVLLSTHVLSEVQAVCDRVLILHQGRLVADDTTERITDAARGTVCTLGLGPGKVHAPRERIISQLGGIEGVGAVHPLAQHDGVHRFEVHADRDVRAELFRWAVAHGHVLVELTSVKQTLEEVFHRLTEAA